MFLANSLFLNNKIPNENEKAIALYRKFGFEIYGRDEQMSYMSLSLRKLDIMAKS